MKSKKLIRFEKEFNAIDKILCFEIPVLNKASKEEDYITFAISIRKTFLVAEHVALTAKEEKSKFVATKKVKIDTDFSVDENLSELYDECYAAILDSEFYEINE